MDSRGEKGFIKFPKIAAKLYNYMISGYNTQAQINEIAQFLASRISGGKLLDIGTGPGRLLFAISNLNPNIELYGLDISQSMIDQANENLLGKQVNIQLGNIKKTEYDDDFFDIITSTGSFYLWDHPEDCIEEINRILKFDSSAYIFETLQKSLIFGVTKSKILRTYKEFNEQDYKMALKSNLKKENIPRRLFAPYFLNKQLNMTYRTSQIEDIICKTSFRDTYKIDRIKLGGLPVWLRIELFKAHE